MKGTAEQRSGEPLKCLWMTAGFLAFRLCDREYDCDNCGLDLAIRRGGESPDKAVVVEDRDSETVGAGRYRISASLFYHPTHVWARVEDEGRVRIGLDDFGRRLVGDIRSIRLPERGARVVASREAWTLDHRIGRIGLVPSVDGTVCETNQALLQNPNLMKTDPYGHGWAFVIEPTSLLEGLKSLYFGRRAQQWYGSEIDELCRSIDAVSPSVGPTLQDGGVPIEDLSRLVEDGNAGRIIQKFLSVRRLRGGKAGGRRQTW